MWSVGFATTLLLLGTVSAMNLPKPKDMGPPPEADRHSYPAVNPPADRSDGLADNCDSFPCLVWEDNFDFLDFEKWQHEITAGGGGVSDTLYHV